MKLWEIEQNKKGYLTWKEYLKAIKEDSELLKDAKERGYKIYNNKPLRG